MDSERIKRADKCVVAILQQLEEYIGVLTESYAEVQKRATRVGDDAVLMKGATQIAQALYEVVKEVANLSQTSNTLFRVEELLGTESLEQLHNKVTNTTYDEPKGMKEAREKLQEALKFWSAVISGRGGYA